MGARRLYCVEAPEPYLEDFGEARVEGGRASIALDPDFMALVQSDRYQVFVTAHDDVHVHVHVRNRSARGFEVYLTTGPDGRGSEGTAPAGGRVPRPVDQPSVSLSWRVVARRKDLVGPRLERVEVRSAPIPQPLGVPTVAAGNRPPEPRDPGTGREGR